MYYREEKNWLETNQIKVVCPSIISLYRQSLCDQGHLALAER